MTHATDHAAGMSQADDDAQAWHLRLTSGAATAEDRRDFEAWYSADRRHRAAYRDLQELWHGLEPLRHAFAGVETAPPKVTSLAQRRRPRRRAVLAGLAAAACLALVAANLPTLRDAVTADRVTAVGERAVVTLPDGSRAHLNTDTALAVDFSPGRRRVTLLRGEAWFQVEKDPDRPFEVAAVDGRTTAVGTAFAVRDRADRATVTVTEGKVRVASPAVGTGDGDGICLTAGQRVSYRRGAAPEPVAAADGESALAWRRGALVIDGLRLAEALAEIDRHRPGRILLLADASALGKVTARLSLDRLDGGIRALAATHGLSVRAVTPYLLIVH